jgi:anti-sigma regulatory factor (Ser/Thr protein kinase)
MRRTQTFPRHAESVGAARRFATEVLSGIDPDQLDSVELMVSELATNSIRHAHAEFELMVANVDGEIRVEVTDRAGGEPRMRRAGPDDPTGRGLQIVNLLSDAWGVEHRADTGKTVWFTVAAQVPPSHDSRRRGETAPL